MARDVALPPAPWSFPWLPLRHLAGLTGIVDSFRPDLSVQVTQAAKAGW